MPFSIAVPSSRIPNHGKDLLSVNHIAQETVQYSPSLQRSRSANFLRKNPTEQKNSNKLDNLTRYIQQFHSQSTSSFSSCFLL